MTLKHIAILVCCLALAAFGSPVFAHTELVSAEPAPGAQLAESPAEIRLIFSEPVAESSQIVLLTEDFQAVEGLVTQFNPAVPEQVYTPVPALEPGVYSVQWSAASVDGHEIKGSYTFSVGQAAQDSAVVEPATNATPASSDGETSSGLRWWLAGIVVVAVGLPLLLLAARRSGRRS